MMTITLPSELERIINEQMAGGHFDSPDEVLRASLQLLEEQEQPEQSEIEELRRQILLGKKDIEEGRYKVYDSADRMIEEIIREGTARYQQRHRITETEAENKRQSVE